ncbi:MAG: LysR family transcriptional regulator [Roseburia sp.]
MEINKYALFADIAETKNFTKTGERMGYTQPGVSHILKSMEAELGFPLFLRTKQGIQLTSYAETILPIVRNMLSINEQLDQTIASLKGLDQGHLTIASFASISRNWLPAVIHAFQKDYPGIEIELLEGGTDDIVKWIDENIADIGLVSRRHTEELEWVSLYEDPLMAILPKSYSTSQDAYPILDMAAQPFIISAEGTDYDIHQALEDSGIKPNIHFSSKDDIAIVSMVANNLGISILPKLVIEGMDSSILALPLEPYYTRELGIAYRSQTNLSPAARRFIEKVQEVLA